MRAGEPPHWQRRSAARDGQGAATFLSPMVARAAVKALNLWKGAQSKNGERANSLPPGQRMGYSAAGEVGDRKVAAP